MDSELVDGLPFSAEKKSYIIETLEPVLEDMVANVVTEMPAQPLDYMIDWLGKRMGGRFGEGRMSVWQANQKLKQKLRQVTENLESLAAGEEIGACEDSDKDDGDEDVEEVQLASTSQRMRKSVSAEAYGDWNQKGDFTPPQHHKTSDQKTRLRDTLKKSFMFQNLDSKDLETIVLAMTEKTLLAGATVISEGEDGDFLFVVERGTLDCVKEIDGQSKVLKSCHSGDVFGEMALLYNCPRAASVVAKESSICWLLDRETFNHVVRDASVRRRNMYDEFLQSVSLLSSLGAYERSQIADVLQAEWFDSGEAVIREGDPGEKFYMVEKGTLNATKVLPDGNTQVVMHYKPGDYFGELALLNNKPRAATVTVSGDQAKVVSMSRSSFMNLLGPLQGLIQKGQEKYQST